MNRVIKFIQINIFRGKYLENLLDFLKSEDPDIISMQEATAGKFNYFGDKSADLFKIIKEKLGFLGVFDLVQEVADSPNSYFGNAVLSKFPVVDSKVVVLKSFRPLKPAEFEDSELFPLVSRHLLDVTLDIFGRRIHAISVHGAWTAPPTDTEENLRQAKIIADHLKSLSSQPFIMGGDLNMPPGTKVIDLISKAATNLMQDCEIEYTTHPTIHKIAPKKLLVDYIFASDYFEVRSISAPEVVVSDHLPVVAELELVAN